MAPENIVLLFFCLAPLLCGAALLLLFRRFRIHRRTGRGLLRLVAGNLVVLLFLASLVILGGEVYFRFLHDESDALGFTKVSTAWFGRHYQMNSSGFRDSVEYRQRPIEGLRLVTFLGDSFTAGHGVKDVEDRFANIIRRARPRWAVQALAQNGWNTREQIQVVEELAEDGYAFDQVVLVYCLNDLGPLVPECKKDIEGMYSASRGPYLVRNSYLLDLLRSRLLFHADPQIHQFYDHLRAGYDGEPWEREKRILLRLVQLVRENGGRFAAVTFPYMHEIGPDRKFGPVHRNLDAFWRRLGVPHLDLTEVFLPHDAEDLVVNSSDDHPNEKAHALAAGAIAAFLERRIGR